MAHVSRVTKGAGDPDTARTAPPRVPPNAPAGGGGPGQFRDADSFRADEEPNETVRHAKAPAVRMLAADAAAQPTSGGTASAAQPPPKTTPMTKQLASQSGPEVTMDVRMLVLEDEPNDNTVKKPASAETRVLVSSGLRTVEAMGWKGMNGKVTQITKKLVVRGTFSVRTSYRTGSSPTDKSEYGRGTTAADKASGNTTLGFHESCHRDEYINYLTNTPFPTFKGKVGMADADFQAAVDEFTEAFKAFGEGYKQLGTAVDEVGDCPQSDWEAGKCP